MTTQTLPEDQLLELLVQLQKTTPEQARAILNGQPAIGYALVPLMAKMGIVNLEVLQVSCDSIVTPSEDFSSFIFSLLFSMMVMMMVVE